MTDPGEVSGHRRRFRVAAVASTLGVALFAVLLSPVLPADARESVSGVGLVIAGIVAIGSGIRRARSSAAADARPWWLLVVAGCVLLVGNTWSAVVGADPVTEPSLFANLCIAVALAISTVALTLFPGVRRRGADLLVMLLDSVVAGGAFMLIASALVYSELLDDSGEVAGAANRALALLFPALDVALVTVAVLLVVRASRGDRVMLGLVAAAFLMYAASDLSYAVLTDKGTYRFGDPLDLGWIAGYLTLGLAAWAPPREESRARTDPGQFRASDLTGTALVFGILAVATVVQVTAGGADRLQAAQSVLWVLIVVAAGSRQLLLTADNITLRRGLERRVADQTAGLRRLARQNEVLITSVGDGVYGVDADGRITFINPSAAQMLGSSAEELRGQRAHDRFHAPGDDGAPLPYAGCYIHQAIAHGDLAMSEEDEYVRADGSTFAVEITASPLVEDSADRGAVVTFRDITQRREVERMKNEFLSVVSHELRTPLTSIRGSLGLLDSGRLGELPKRAVTLVQVALQSSERLTRLINDLLDIERIESGTKPMDLQTSEAAGLLSTAARLIEGMATQAKVSVAVGVAEGRVLADEDQIVQALLNLLGNAIKFSDPGSVVRMDAQTVGGNVHFRVSDDGRGIPADKLESIFERFEQVDSSDTRQKGGTGLGLTISRGIVEKHGGRIWAEDGLARGATIHFTLPSVLGSSRSTAAAAPATPAPGTRHVLVCDDDETVVELFCSLLRQHGFRATGVTSGDRALELIRAEPPHAVVLDLMMPGTTGADVLRAVRGAEPTQDIPVVVVSGLGPETNEAVARETDEWLVKPVSETRLVEAVTLAVSGRRSTGTRVLLVEDDEGLAKVLSAMLDDAGLEVVHAASVAEAITRGPAWEPDVIVLDLQLPDGSGEDVVAAFQQRRPLAQTPLVVYSAVDVKRPRRDDLHLGPTVFLTKGSTGPEALSRELLKLLGAVAATDE
ncbi:response regulator [Nocardioides sp. 503]|uniref:hybrid sensor histidine kinase/response regulator n=1 Tax=Nocardioides sp. 503 TaxID=2508326 RepID=UPI0010700AC4|nr:response regulator [Nocardioides sp. 503]